ncbi:Protein of unknown function [Bacillus mycoides]|nr:Protein of unknown function [Bacillus mycoides]
MTALIVSIPLIQQFKGQGDNRPE